MNSIRTLVAGLVLLTTALAAQAQPLSLQECLRYGREHNLALQRARLEISRNDGRIVEGVASYLPQITASGSFTNNLILPTQIIPGAIFGQPGQDIAVQFGTKYNAAGGIDVSQVLYNQAIITGIKAAKASQDVAELDIRRSEEDLVHAIASAYYTAQTMATQQTLLEANRVRIDTLLGAMQARLDRGFARKTDYDRLLVNRTNIETEQRSLALRIDQQLLVLKYHMGMPLDSTVSLPAVPVDVDAAPMPIDATPSTTPVSLLQLDSQIGLTELSLDQIHAGYLPILSLSFRSSYQAQQNTADIFGSDSRWFGTSALTLSLSVPIFDGLNKSGRSQQVQAQIQQLEIDRRSLAQQIDMQQRTARNSITMNVAGIELQRRNVQLAESVYATTKAQLDGGVVTISDLLQAESSLREAQVNYVRAVLDARMAELDLMRTTGRLLTLQQ